MAKRMTKKKARRAPAKRKTTRRKAARVYNFTKRKAVRAKPRRKRATGYTVGKAPIRRRKLNGVRKRRRINGTINGAMNTNKLMSAAKGGVMVFAGSRGARILSSKVGADINPNLKAAGVILLGALFHGKAPDLMKGVIAEGVGMIADPMLVSAGVMNGAGTINAYLTEEDVDAIEEAAMNGFEEDNIINGAEDEDFDA
jgi:hypothetical protein